ncbi:MAG: hypothetical protein ACJA1L_000676 [Paracoccaceae bacterium]
MKVKSEMSPRLHWILAAVVVIFYPISGLVFIIFTREWESYAPGFALFAAYVFLVVKLWRKGGDAGLAWRWIARPTLVLVFPAWAFAAIILAITAVGPSADLVDPVEQRIYLSETLDLDLPIEATPLLARRGRIADDRLAMVVLDADPSLIAKWFKTLPRDARATARPEPAAVDRTSFNWLLPCGEAAPAPDAISTRAHEVLDAFCTPERWDPKAKFVELSNFDRDERLAFIVLSPGRRAILILLNDY